MMSGDGDDNHSCGVTTLMFRNVPRRYGNTTLLREIEFMVGQGSVDMVFLPWDSEERNMGNAFVDFVDCNFAMLALQTMRGRCWARSGVIRGRLGGLAPGIQMQGWLCTRLRWRGVALVVRLALCLAT